jgi:diguanylate cyclase (GGDEF)-like protein
MSFTAIADSLAAYRLAQRIPTGGSYVLRLIAVCFVGTHIPLIVACLYFLSFAEGGLSSRIPELLVLLVATLLGTAFTIAGVRMVLAPIVRSSRALGLYVDKRILPALPLEYTDEAGRLMAAVQTVTERLEMALRQQERLATLDPLTGIPNRRVLFEGSVQIFNDARRSKTSLAMVVMDIDRFKTINDTYGHAVGDIVIKAVADVIRDGAEDMEIIARLGGEEFAILMPGVSLTTARDRTERMRTRISALTFSEMPDRTITISAGVALARPQSEATIHSVLERADHAMYSAKESGRDRVTVFG